MLSDLQKSILQLAFENRKESFSHLRRSDVTASEVKVRFYGLEPRSKRGCDTTPGSLQNRLDRAAAVAISKSFDRLTKRGLTERVRHGVRLTPDGERWARNLQHQNAKKSLKKQAILARIRSSINSRG